MIKIKNDCQNNITVLNNRTKKFVYKLYKDREMMLEDVSTATMIK
jgi:hypothetical protein